MQRRAGQGRHEEREYVDLPHVTIVAFVRASPGRNAGTRYDRRVVLTGVFGAVLGVAAGPVLRRLIIFFAVPAGTGWRRTCPACDTAIPWLVPSGACRTCGARLGPRAGVVELVAGTVTGVLGLAAAAPLVVPLWWAGMVGVALSFVDVAVHRLPDRLTGALFAGSLVGLAGVAAGQGQWARLGWAVLWAIAAAAAYFVLVLIAPAAMGLGDAKLALGLGLVLGWFGGVAVLLGIAAGLLINGVLGVGLLLGRRVGRKDELAHGPSMLAGALLVTLLLS